MIRKDSAGGSWTLVRRLDSPMCSAGLCLKNLLFSSFAHNNTYKGIHIYICMYTHTQRGEGESKSMECDQPKGKSNSGEISTKHPNGNKCMDS